MRVGKERVDVRKQELIRQYSGMGFNWQSVIRLDSFKDLMINDKYHRTHIRPYSGKMSIGYIDRVMDNLVKRRNIEIACAFLEQDDYLNNHLHIAWSCPIMLTRKQLARSMKTKEKYLRDTMPILDIKGALDYFSKRLYANGTYSNLYV